jgi:hypothetical protein
MRVVIFGVRKTKMNVENFLIFRVNALKRGEGENVRFG